MKVRHKQHADIVFEVIDELTPAKGHYYVCQYRSPPGRFAGRLEVSKADFEPIPDEHWEDVSSWFKCDDLILAPHIGSRYRICKIDVNALNAKADPRWVFIIEGRYHGPRL